MKEELKVKNFGPIKEATLEVKDVMLFIGPQASGKSTLAKLLAIVMDWEFVRNMNKKTFQSRRLAFGIDGYFNEKTTFFEYTEEDYNFSYDGKVNVNERLFKYLSLEADINNTALVNEYMLKQLLPENISKSSFYDIEGLLRLAQMSIMYINISINKDGLFDMAINKSIQLEINDILEGFDVVVYDLYEFKKPPLKDSEQLKEQYFKSHELYMRYYKKLKQVNSKIRRSYQLFSHYPLYIPTERTFIAIASGSFMNLVVNDVPISKSIINFGAAFEKSRDKLKKLDIPSFNIQYEYDDGQDKIVLENGKKIKLKESASGFQSIIPMLVVIEHYTTNINHKYHFIIEEPELNLFPSAQKALVEFLVEKCIKKGHRLTITTHSPYIITAFNNLIQANNVAIEHPETKEQLNEIIPEKQWLPYEQVGAYFVDGGTATSIMDDEYQMIDASPLDEVSDMNSRIFDQLLELKYQD